MTFPPKLFFSNEAIIEESRLLKLHSGNMEYAIKQTNKQTNNLKEGTVIVTF